MTKYIFYKSQETYLLFHPNAIFSDVYTHKLFSDIKSFSVVIEFVFIKFDFIVGHFIKINSTSGQNRILAFSNFTPQTFNTILTKYIWDSFHEVCKRYFSDFWMNIECRKRNCLSMTFCLQSFIDSAPSMVKIVLDYCRCNVNISEYALILFLGTRVSFFNRRPHNWFNLS